MKKYVLIVFIFLLSIFVAKAQLAEIYNEENLDFDRDYRDNYLADYNYFSDLEFVITSGGDKLHMDTSTTSQTLRGININGKNFAFDFIGCDAWERYCSFRINGVPTKKTFDPNYHPDKQTSFRFDEDYSLLIETVNYASVGTFDIIDIIIDGSVSSCGDSICGEGETCSSCTQDCGCSSGYICESEQCVEEIICGDNICDTNENCCMDCGCGSGYECISNSCVLEYECISDSDCNNDEACVDNECEIVLLPPEENDTATLDSTDLTISDITPTEQDKVEITVAPSSIEEEKEDKVIETQSDVPEPPPKEESTVIQKIIAWFFSLFG
ncbi:hypothetical protein HYU09_01805 [Candidatus Woesearchaeota archaeon]|nr:hypothetical protein [Candidatus Woesearchaeota archaeon]